MGVTEATVRAQINVHSTQCLLHIHTHLKTRVQITKLALCVSALFKYYLQLSFSNYSASYRTTFEMNLPLTSRGFYL